MSYDSYRNEMRLRAWEYRMMLYHAGMWVPVNPYNVELTGRAKRMS